MCIRDRAYRKGIYKQYCTFEGNDSKVRGKIDIARHIRLNPLFNGKIAYSYREYTINNNTNRLIPVSYTHLDVYKRQSVDLRSSTIQEAWFSKAFDDFRSHLKNACPECKQDVYKRQGYED